MTKPFVSIITPSYNQGEYIEETLQSVQCQEYENIEHIVVDGGSTDNTIEVLEKYQGRYNLEWLSEPDEGQADAINKGFSLANGDILGWLNSDDVYLSKSTVSTAVNALLKYPKADIVNGRGIRLEKDGSWDHPIKRRDHKLSHSGLKQIASVLQPATFWYRYVWEEVGINSKLEYTFDWEFLIRATESYNLLPIPDYIIGYRWQGDNKTTTGGLPRAREIRDVTGKYLGKNSWQYQLLCFYCGVYSLSTIMPRPIQKRIENALTFFSNAVSYLTLKQISGI